MKLINSKGRTLLEVTDARVVDYQGKPTVFYSYRGEISGYGPLASLHGVIGAILADNPSGRSIGFLPRPQEAVV
jgi:hypothetical protein